MIKQLSLIQVINPNDIFPLIKGGGLMRRRRGIAAFGAPNATQ